jgi:bifunctional non-homologous end joining protein LigD
MWLDGRDLRDLPLTERKQRLAALLTGCASALRISEALDTDPNDLVAFARAHKLEGVVAKRRDSRYESGKRSAAWQKFKTYQEAEFPVGGFLPGPEGVTGAGGRLPRWQGVPIRCSVGSVLVQRARRPSCSMDGPGRGGLAQSEGY